MSGFSTKVYLFLSMCVKRISRLFDCFPVFIDDGTLYAPGPGPSTFCGRKWSLFLMLELNLVPKE